jgi:hypothetical protein
MVLIILALAVLLSACAPAPAPAASKGAIQIFDPWVRLVPGDNTAAYMLIKNTGSTPDKLVKAEFAAAKKVELMDTKMADGMMSMFTIPTIDIPANGQAELKTGGLHVMLMMLTEPLKEGSKVQIKLTFEKAGDLTIEALVKNP